MVIRMMLLALCAVALASAQGQYVFRHEFNLSGAAGVWTIQQPTSNALRVNFRYITISTSAALTLTMERQCTTPASSTSVTPSRKNPEFTSTPAKATAFHTSNATGCTIAYGPFTIGAGTTTINFDGDYMVNNGTDKGFTIRTASTTAAGSINWHFEEVR